MNTTPTAAPASGRIERTCRVGSALLAALLGAASLGTVGCQIDVAGQTLPSGYWLSDDVQYYPPGPEFKLANEAAALAEQRAAQVSEPQQ